jgi:V/A-type H+-transporting ATPase subunit D
MNLLALRSQIRLARQGADLLSRKKEALLREFFAQVDAVYPQRVRLTESLRRETVEAILTEAVLGRQVLASAAQAAARDFAVRAVPQNLWGVRILDLEHSYRARDAATRPGSLRGLEPGVDEVAEGFARIVLEMLELAPRELRLRRLGEEIRRTNRKINALQQQVIPRLEARARAIDQVLEERARDDVIRLKRLKQKKR